MGFLVWQNFDLRSTVYIFSQAFYAGVDPGSFTSRHQEITIALLLTNSLSHDWYMQPKYCPGICTQASRKSSRNVHAKTQIWSLIKCWILYTLLLLFTIPTDRERHTHNWYSLKQWCLFQRPEIQVNKYKFAKLSTKAEFFPRESILRFIHQSQLFASWH